MKYKVGDKARVRSDLVVNETYPKGECRFIATMSPFIGKEITIKGIHSSGIRYLIEGNSDFWTDEMLEDVEKEFKLPEKWHIIVQGNEEQEVYRKFFEANNSDSRWLYNIGYYYGFSDGEYVSNMVGTRITFDQFKKYVLKSELTPVKEEVKFEAGKWYKLKYARSKFSYLKFLRVEKLESYNKVWYSDLIWNNEYKSDSYIANTEAEESAVLLTDLSEIQQYLPDNHPDKIKMRTKKVEDLKYPDVVHCNSQQERDFLKKYVSEFDISKWTSADPYLLIGGGCSSLPYVESECFKYVNYEFSDIIFPEEEIVNKEDEEFKIGAYIVFISDFGSSKKGDVDKIKTVYSPEQIMLEKEGISWGRLGEGFSKRCKYFLTLEEAQAFSAELLGKNKVEAKPMLSKEELLAEAKRRYPAGTVFNAARGGRGEYTVGSNSVFRYNYDDAICIKDDGNGTVYYRGEWAEITSRPFNSPIAEKEVERLSFYVKYNTSFTEDLYNKLMEWCVKNNVYKTRGWSDTYKGLVENKYFLYDNASLNGVKIHGYGVDNNRQNCINEYSVQQVKELIGYKEFLEHSKYVECTGLKEVDVMFWRGGFTIGEIYLVEEDDETTTFRINGMWCDKSQFKPSTKEAFEKQDKSGIQKIGDSSERYTVALDPFDAESSSDGIEVRKFPLDRGMGLYEQMAKLHMQEHYYSMGRIKDLYKTPVEPKDCFESDEIYVPIIKTEVKQIKL